MKNLFVNLINMAHSAGVILIFLFFAIVMAFLGIWYNRGLHPKNDKVSAIVKKFTVNDYTLPDYVAERYLIWLNMRTFFFVLNHLLTLLGIVASLMTVFYASTDTQLLSVAQQGETPQGSSNHTIVFLSLLSLSFTVSNLFINSGSKANMSQHAWRELDICIMKTIHKTGLSGNEKNKIIVDKIAEMERYIEPYER